MDDLPSYSVVKRLPMPEPSTSEPSVQRTRNAYVRALHAFQHAVGLLSLLGPKKRLTDKELALFTDLDFVTRVALSVPSVGGKRTKSSPSGATRSSRTMTISVRSPEFGFTAM